MSCTLFSSGLHAHLICYFRLKTTIFTFFITFFFLMLSMDDTLHKEDVLMIFDERKYRTEIKSCSQEHKLSSKFCCWWVSNNEFPTNVTCHRQLSVCMQAGTKQTNLYSSLFLFSDLSSFIFLNQQHHWRNVICMLSRVENSLLFEIATSPQLREAGKNSSYDLF